MIQRILYLLVISLLVSCVAKEVEKEEEAVVPEVDSNEVLSLIQSKMDTQQECWNVGDLDCFMESYWKSDSLLFLGKTGISFGWQTTLDNYKKGYASVEEMGKLTFTNEVLRFLDKETIQVIGKWYLKRGFSLGDLEGHYSLIWQNKEGDWVIISDHSS